MGGMVEMLERNRAVKMQKIYRKYNLSKTRFAKMCHVSRESLSKYEQEDSSLKEETAKKIELAIRVLVYCNMRCPDNIMGKKYNVERIDRLNAVDEYERRFERLLQKVSARK
jgi:DNA-binding XRE family transcriptional regulator